MSDRMVLWGGCGDGSYRSPFGPWNSHTLKDSHGRNIWSGSRLFEKHQFLAQGLTP